MNAWVIAKKSSQLVGAFRAAGWAVEAFAPRDRLPLSTQVYYPDVIVLEVVEESILSKIQEIHNEVLDSILAVVANWDLAQRARETGANEVVVAPANPVELLFRANWLVNQAKIVRVGELAIDVNAREVRLRNESIKLSPIEFRLLACLANHVAQVVSFDELLDEVWGDDPELGGTPDQVKSSVKRLRTKIESDPHHLQYLVSLRRERYQLRNQAQWQEATREE